MTPYGSVAAELSTLHSIILAARLIGRAGNSSLETRVSPCSAPPRTRSTSSGGAKTELAESSGQLGTRSNHVTSWATSDR
jgi:hypothetical protein